MDFHPKFRRIFRIFPTIIITSKSSVDRDDINFDETAWYLLSPSHNIKRVYPYNLSHNIRDL